MLKKTISTPSEALFYLAECHLLTVEMLSKRRVKSDDDFQRHICIAQTSLDWLDSLEIKFESPLIDQVLNAGSVERWARNLTPKAPASVFHNREIAEVS